MILHRFSNRTTRLMLIATVPTALIAGLTLIAFAQRGNQDQTQPASVPAIPIFKGSGGAATRTNSRKVLTSPMVPQRFSAAFTNQIFKQLGGKPVGEYCHVTPQRPQVAGRCHLDFENFHSVRSNEDKAIAIYQSGGPSLLFFGIQPPAPGKKYLIDCAVVSLETQSLNVYGNFETSPQFPGIVSPTNGHVLMALDVIESHLYYLEIYKKDLTPFYFYGCTATEYVPEVSAK